MKGLKWLNRWLAPWLRAQMTIYRWNNFCWEIIWLWSALANWKRYWVVVCSLGTLLELCLRVHWERSLTIVHWDAHRSNWALLAGTVYTSPRGRLNGSRIYDCIYCTYFFLKCIYFSKIQKFPMNSTFFFSFFFLRLFWFSAYISETLSCTAGINISLENC